jgi:5-methylcytosine-specific restriction endonuclease McrA
MNRVLVISSTKQLEKWRRTCAYCGAQNVSLQIEHIRPRAKAMISKK